MKDSEMSIRELEEGKELRLDFEKVNRALPANSEFSDISGKAFRRSQGNEVTNDISVGDSSIG